MFGLDDILIGMAVSGGTGLLSKLLSGESEKTKGLKALKRRLASIQQLTRSQIEDELSGIDKAGKSTVLDAANQSAISVSGRQNAMASIMSKMAPAVAQARVQREGQLLDYNRNLPLQKLQIESGLNSQEDTDTPQMDAMNVIAMGMQAAAMNSMAKTPTVGTTTVGNVVSPYNTFLNPSLNVNSDYLSSSTLSGTDNVLSFLKKRKKSFNQLGF